MAVIAVNFVVPLTVMFYCYYNVSATVRRYKASNCLDSINVDWSDQMDVTKVKIEPNTELACYTAVVIRLSFLSFKLVLYSTIN